MSDIKEIVAGTIVELITGGPTMVVQTVAGNPDADPPVMTAKCQWFAGKKLDHGYFPFTSLKIVQPEVKGE